MPWHSRLLANELGLTADQCQVTFQSGFGKAKWLQPYSDPTLVALPASHAATQAMGARQ